eukprot:UN28035
MEDVISPKAFITNNNVTITNIITKNNPIKQKDGTKQYGPMPPPNHPSREIFLKNRNRSPSIEITDKRPSLGIKPKFKSIKTVADLIMEDKSGFTNPNIIALERATKMPFRTIIQNFTANLIPKVNRMIT